MKIQFIFHSSYLVTLDQCYLLFDYYMGELPELDPEKPLYIMASHVHYDHFAPVIFQLMKKYPGCVFILSDDISEELINEALEDFGVEPRICRVRPGSRLFFSERGELLRELTVDADLKEASESEASNGISGDSPEVVIEAFGSTDQGVSYLVTAEQRSIFHSGDLNDWWWANVPHSQNDAMKAAFLSIVDKVRDRLEGQPLDVLFLPMDPVMGEGVFHGPVEFLEEMQVRHFFPMHMWEQYSICDRFLKEHPEFSDRFHPIRAAGDEFTLE